MSVKPRTPGLKPPALSLALSLCALVVGVLIIAMTTTITATVTAKGVIVAARATRAIVLKTGGTLAKISVHEGSSVREGDLLFTLDTAALDRALARITRDRGILRLRETRLGSLASGASDLVLPPDLEQSLAAQGLEGLLKAERELFKMEKSTLLAERTRLRAEHRRAGERIEALAAQIRTKEDEIEMLTREIERARKPGTGDDQLKIRDLRPLDPAAEQRMFALERDRLRLMGDVQRLRSAKAEAAAERADLDRRLETLAKEARRRALADEAAALASERAAAEVRAPIEGTVRNLAVEAPGARIEPGMTVLTIAANGDHLEIEADIAPRDVGAVAIGQRGWIRLPSGPPELAATVEETGAARPRDEARFARFIARLTWRERPRPRRCSCQACPWTS